ncbi:MAG TPA: ParA family protein [Rhodocyclaceae bacterium]
MQVTVVANPKGGVGKSTLATNLAGFFARRGESVMLGDVDRQQSARDWLALRPAELPPIAGWEIDRNAPARPPKGTTQAVLDTPAGLHGKLLAKTLRVATRVVIPLQPSLFDILATRHFLDALVEERAFRKGQLAVGVVAMRVDPRTRAAAELDRFLAQTEVPVVAHIRSTQLYVQLAARGLTLFDVNPNPVAQDLEQWDSLIRWLDS